MKKHFFFMAMALAVFASSGCQKEIAEISESELEKPAPQEQTMLFSATTDVQTKTTLSPDNDVYNVIWQEGDVIRINGYVCNMTDVQPEGCGPGNTKAIFSGSVPNRDTYEAWYPIGMSTAWYGEKKLPATQTYTPDNVIGFPMYAIGETTTLQFKNLCGIIRINLKGTKSVSSIGLKDRSDSPKGLSGSFDVVDFAAVPEGTDGVTLNCETPVQLKSDEFTSFLIAVPAGSYGKLQITVSASDGTAAILTSNKAIAVQRSMITNINISSPNFKIPGAKITYTTTNTTQISKYAVGADASALGEGLTVSGHTYDSTTKSGEITFSGTVTKIGENAFSGLNNLKSIVIPETVTAIEREGFYECRSLESINWPESLTSVGYRAFSMGMALSTIDLSHLTTIGKEAFFDCAPATVTIGSNITSIGVDAFRGGKMTSVTFNAMPETMGTGVFMDCKSLTSATFDCDVPALPGYTFQDCATLKSVTFNGSLGAVGSREFYNCKSLTDIIGFDDTGITSIGSEAFRVAPLSSSFDIPSTVTSIGEAAFYDCTGLVSITIPESSVGRQAFQNCTKLESLTFSGSTKPTALSYHAFYGCTKLTSTSIPACVTSIEEGVFGNCGFTSLPDGWGRSGITYGIRPFIGCPITHITFPDNWTSIPNYFCGGINQLATVDIGQGVASIGNYAFENCTALTSVNIPSNVTNIGNNCFSNCGVTSVAGMNRSNLTVGNYAFSESKLQSVDISNWTTVPYYCFYKCSDMTSVTFGEGLKLIDRESFEYCTSLTSVAFPSTLEKINDSAFRYSGLTSLPSGMHDMTFGSSIFSFTPITSVILPEGVTTVGSYMFSDCKSLTDVVIPDSVTRIYDNAFNGCSALKTVDIGTGIKQIDGYCFNNNNNLETLIIRASAVPTLASTGISGSRLPFIYVPSALIDTYKAASVWTNYKSYFRPLDSEDRSGRAEDYNDGGNL